MKIWTNIKLLFNVDLDKMIDNSFVTLEKRIKALEDKLETVIDHTLPGFFQAPEPSPDPVEQLHEMQAESYKHDILQMSVNEFFKFGDEPPNTKVVQRIKHCASNYNIKTVGDLVQKSIPELLEYNHFGEKSLRHVRDCLRRHGLSLRGES